MKTIDTGRRALGRGTATLALVMALSAAALSACGGGGGGGGNPSPPPSSPAPPPAPVPPAPPPPAAITIGGNVSGLTGSGLVLQNNSGDDLAVSDDGSFVFATALSNGSNYSVSIKSHPSYPAQDCTLTNASGSASANVTNVAISCDTIALATVQADAGAHSAIVTFNDPSVVSANLFISTARGCDTRNYSACPGGSMVALTSSSQTIDNLESGQPYYFQVEYLFANGARGISREAGARPGPLGFNSNISDVAPKGDGTVYLSGNFTRVGAITGSAVPLALDTGRLARPDFPIVSGAVYAATPDNSGGWYIGGLFNSVGTTQRKNLAHILADGTVDNSWNPKTDDRVAALAVRGDKVYAGGQFYMVNGSVRNGLVELDAHGAVTPWDAGLNGQVAALETTGSTLKVGGSFTVIRGLVRTCIAAVDANGAVTGWQPNANGTVSTITTDGDHTYVGGTFTLIGGSPRNRIAELTAEGVVTPWNPDANDAVYAMAVTGDTIYLGGGFTKVGAQPRQSLAAVDRAGTGTVKDWNPAANNFVTALQAVGGTVYVSGAFTTISGTPRNFLAGLDAAGNLTDWDPNPDKYVLTLVARGGPNPELYAGGVFDLMGGVARNRLAALDATGELTSWDPDSNGFVSTLTIAGDLVYAGGYFTSIGGELRKNLAAIDFDGAATAWNPAPNQPIYSIAVADGRIFVGGTFTGMLNGLVPRGHLASFDAHGELELWDPRLDNDVYALATSGTGSGLTLYAGGNFTKAGTTPRNHLAAFTGSGALTSWDPNADQYVTSLAVYSNFIFAGGAFNKVSGITRNYIALMYPDTGGLALWDPNAEDRVNELVVSPDGKTLYAAGDFTYIGGAARNGLAAIGSNGAALPWNPKVDDYVGALALSGSKVYVGGDFNSLNGSPRRDFAVVDAGGNGNAIP